MENECSIPVYCKSNSTTKSPVEKKFDTITGRGDSMINAANLSLHERCKLFKEAFQTATLLDGLVLITKDGERKTRFEH